MAMMIQLINRRKSMDNKMQSEVEIMDKQAPQKTALSGLFGALALMSCSVAMAGSLSVTNTFTAGNAANAADVNLNFDDVEAAVNDNFTRITALEGGGGGQTTVAVGCDVDADALTQIGTYSANTTYEITGACNGPIEVNADHVWFVGQDVSAAIVLPGTAPDSAAVYGNHARALRLEALLIDASAFSGAGAVGSGSGGVWVRDGSMIITNTDVTGGEYGINPFRNAYVRLEDSVNVTGFIHGGIAVGENSVLSARGQVTVSTTFSDGGWVAGVSAYRNSVADFRAGLNVTMPAANEGTGFNPNAIESTNHSYMRIRNSGSVDINGRVDLNGSSSLELNGGDVAGDIQVGNNSRLEMDATNQSAGGILAFMNSAVIINDSSIGPVEAVAESAVQFKGGTITVSDDGFGTSIECELASSIVVGDLNGYPDFSTTAGVELWENCYLGFFNGTITGNVYVSDNSTLTMETDSGDGTSATITGDVVVSASSAALLEGDTVSIGGNVLVQRSSHVSLDSANGLTVTGNFQVRAGSGMSVQNSGTGIIGGTLECDTTTGTYLDIFPQNLDVASTYLVDFSITPVFNDFYCGFLFP
jgi:hypothetical protein